MKAYLPALIPILVPALIALLKSWVPKIPRSWLPILAPVLGALIDAATAYLAGKEVNPVLAMALGSAGVGFREIYDQVSGNAQKPVLRTILPVFVLAVVGLSACATPQVSLPAGAACVAYGNARADYAAAKMLATQYCKSGTLPAEACETLKQVDVRAQIYRDQVEKALMDPTQPVDWPKVLQYSEEVVGILLKITP
jgi:hypothetical protein